MALIFFSTKNLIKIVCCYALGRVQKKTMNKKQQKNSLISISLKGQNETLIFIRNIQQINFNGMVPIIDIDLFPFLSFRFISIAAGLIEVIIYSSPDDKKKNRGFCFLEYESHKAASLAKRRLGTGRIKVMSL